VQKPRGSGAGRAKIDYSELERLAASASDATVIRVFRHTAAYYGQEANRALAGMCINLGGNMVAVARSLSRAASAIERAALSREPLGVADLKLLREAEADVERLIGWLNHDVLHDCLRELERRRARASEPLAALSDIERVELVRGAAMFLRGETDFRPSSSPDRPQPAERRYLVAELEPTVWRIPFELEVDDLAEAFEWFAERSKLHVAMYGEPRPMILLDRQTNTVLRSHEG
jgi:hypothetical protein